MFTLGLSGSELALGRLQIRFRGLNLRRGGQSLSFRIVHFLLSHQSRFRFRHAVQPVELELHDFVLRFDAAQFALGVRNLVGGILDGSIVLLQLRLQFGDLEGRQDLVRLYAGTIVDLEFLHEAGLFRIHVDLLKGNKL